MYYILRQLIIIELTRNHVIKLVFLIKLGQDIIPTSIVRKFGDDRIRIVLVRERTQSIYIQFRGNNS